MRSLEDKGRLGIETQRQWSDLAIDRTTPMLFGLYSLVALFGRALHPDGCIPVAQAAWYRKHTATFHDVLAEVRQRGFRKGQATPAKSLRNLPPTRDGSVIHALPFPRQHR